MWQKPSAKYCDTGACVEVAPCESGHCVEVDNSNGPVQIRNSKRPLESLVFDAEEFSAFIQAVKGGEYDGYIV